MAIDNNDIVISIDPKKNRIRIFKKTLRALEMPRYIQILVNPDTSVIAIQCMDTRPLHQYHRIKWKELEARRNYEIYSSFLVDKLKAVCVDWSRHEAYRVYGRYYPNSRVAAFDLKNAVPFSGEVGDTNE